MNWEKIDDYTRRAKVYKGWMVMVMTIVDNKPDECLVSMCFVPDPMYAWTING